MPSEDCHAEVDRKILDFKKLGSDGKDNLKHATSYDEFGATRRELNSSEGTSKGTFLESYKFIVQKSNQPYFELALGEKTVALDQEDASASAYSAIQSGRGMPKASKNVSSIWNMNDSHDDPIHLYPCQAPVHRARRSFHDSAGKTQDPRERRRRQLLALLAAIFNAHFSKLCWVTAVISGIASCVDPYTVSLLALPS
jgi:hypothetical protein